MIMTRGCVMLYLFLLLGEPCYYRSVSLELCQFILSDSNDFVFFFVNFDFKIFKIKLALSRL